VPPTGFGATLREPIALALDVGDPMSPLRWTCKSAAKLAGALTAQGWPVSATTVGKLLDGLGYRLHALPKAREGAAHPDRNTQFEHINATAAAFIQRGQPVISVDTKKKELVGDFKNAGREWQPIGEPERVRVHDFPATRWARRFHTASPTWRATKRGSASGATTIRRPSPSRRSASGGR
jgi:Rhodopirellula transposase DDE domain